MNDSIEQDETRDAARREGWWRRLSGGLKRTSASIGGAISDIVTKHLLPRFGARDVGSLLREELLQFRSELAKVKGRKKETLSPRRINAIMNVMSLILAEASDRYKFTSPYYNIKPLRIPKSDVEPFTLAEVQRILDTVREDFRDYYTVRFFTGMRTGEVDGLKWKYVDFERRLILVRETVVLGDEEYTKTDGSQRDIQMSQLVFDPSKVMDIDYTKRTEYLEGLEAILRGDCDSWEERWFFYSGDLSTVEAKQKRGW